MAKSTETSRKKTAYQKLQKAATNHCNTGSAASKERLQAAEKRYKEDAMKKGKTAAQINEILQKVKKCPAKVGAKKKK